MEPIDIYNEKREKTGIIKYRGKDTLEPGEYFLGVGALLINDKKEILIGKRSETKSRYPGFWELNGGCNRAGETSLESIVREIKEELGISLPPEKYFLLKSTKGEYTFRDLWTARVNENAEELTFPDGEVAGAKWVDFKTFNEYHDQGIIVDSNNITNDDFEKAINLLDI